MHHLKNYESPNGHISHAYVAPDSAVKAPSEHDNPPSEREERLAEEARRILKAGRELQEREIDGKLDELIEEVGATAAVRIESTQTDEERERIWADYDNAVDALHEYIASIRAPIHLPVEQGTTVLVKGNPVFGDLIRGIHASEGNPQRDGFYVETIVQHGRFNNGAHYRVTDGKGSFWEYPVESTEVRRANAPPILKTPRDHISADEGEQRFVEVGQWEEVGFDNVDMEAIEREVHGFCPGAPMPKHSSATCDHCNMSRQTLEKIIVALVNDGERPLPTKHRATDEVK